jgi:hypothetical protein
MRCPPQEHGSASSRPSARRGAQMSGCLPCLGHPVRILGQCPVSGVRACDVHASGVRVSGCGRSVSARSASASAVSASGDFVERRTATRQEGAWLWPPCHIRERLGQLPEPEPGRRAGAGRAGQRRRRAGPGRRRGRRSGSRPGSIAWPARDTPVARQDRPSVEEQRPRAVHPICGMALQVVRVMLAGIRPTMIWAEPVATTIGSRCDRPGPRVARSGRSLGSTVRRARGPGAAQASSERHRPSRVSALSWENSGGPART